MCQLLTIAFGGSLENANELYSLAMLVSPGAHICVISHKKKPGESDGPVKLIFVVLVREQYDIVPLVFEHFGW